MQANTSSDFLSSTPRLSTIESDILFIDDLAQVVRASRTTIERRRKDGSLPFPELPSIDKRPRWSRRVVTEILSSRSPQRRGIHRRAAHAQRVKA
jgi:hypothetical protein